ncbi:MAG: hypothetical protein KKA19_05110 [Candidatus Margulisbacteria bacterium]|nr:hypothetical protein [Candidatus Margulisiibacteriota bacterium]
MTRAVFLDFDGVLFDTVKEAYIICKLAENKGFSIAEASFQDTEYKLFKEYRYLIAHAWEYQALLAVIKKYLNQEITDCEAEFLQASKTLDPYKSEAYEKNYFRQRTILRESNQEKWLEFNEPYQFLYDIARNIENYLEQVYIITTKDKPAVLDLFLSRCGLLNRCKVYDKDSCRKYNTKGGLIANLMDKNKYLRGLYIDDCLLHLKSAQYLQNVECYLASWGYTARNQEGISQDEAVKKINDFFRGQQCMD